MAAAINREQTATKSLKGLFLIICSFRNKLGVYFGGGQKMVSRAAIWHARGRSIIAQSREIFFCGKIARLQIIPRNESAPKFQAILKYADAFCPKHPEAC
jgi:hypothetical protein